MKRLDRRWYVRFPSTYIGTDSSKALNWCANELSFFFFFFLKIADSGLPLHAFDSFEDAAKKVISLAGS